MSDNKKVIAITANSYNYLVKFRSELAYYLKKQGYDVIFISPMDACAQSIKNDIEHFTLSFNKAGYNFISLVVSTFQFIRIIRNRRVNIIINNTIKPLVAFSLIKYIPFIKIDVYSIVTGLGYIFTHDTIKTRFLRSLIRPLYKLSTSANLVLFLHNKDDEELLKSKHFIIKKQMTCITYGSGVDLNKFYPSQVANYNVFVFIGRLLRDKGICEYLSAARIIKKDYENARFLVVGDYDSNPSGISRSYVQSYIDSNDIEYFGYLEDVRDVLAYSMCIVLPSYREGCPRAVIEAMAIGRAVITTNVSGCRETTIHGYNGYLVSRESVDDLVVSIKYMIMNPDLVDSFCINSRKYAEKKFDIDNVNQLIYKNIK